MNPAEPKDFPLGRWNLYIGGAGRVVPGYINLDLVRMAEVDVAADAEQLPFPPDIFQRVECDAVLEHVRNPRQVMSEIRRVLAPGGYAHLVAPFCHPLHEYPKDFQRFTPDGLKESAGPMEVVAEGWRTGPTATLLVIVIEYVKLLFPFRAWRAVSHVACGWLLFPLDTWTCCSCDHPEPGASATMVTSGFENQGNLPLLLCQDLNAERQDYRICSFATCATCS